MAVTAAPFTPTGLLGNSPLPSTSIRTGSVAHPSAPLAAAPTALHPATPLSAHRSVPTGISDAIRGATPDAPSTGGMERRTYTAGNRELPEGQLGKLVRKEGDAPSGDSAVDMAHDNAKVVYDFYKTVLGRNSLDGKGMPLISTVHFGKNFNNAYWDGTHMTYGDGDGRMFSSLSGGLDVVGHEMTHAVTERTSGLDYENQPGALNESWSDVMGELIQQWHADPKAFTTTDGAKKSEWLIGETVFTPGRAGDGLRSMKAPGTAYSGDPQPADMAHYKRLPNTDEGDYGGVHINSGIPNRAAYEAAIRLGGDKVAKIWYKAMTSYLKPDSQFSDAVTATTKAATDLYGAKDSEAVAQAWAAVGLKAGQSSRQDPVDSGNQDSWGDDGANGGGWWGKSNQTAPVPHHGAGDGVVPPWLTSPSAPAFRGLPAR